MIRSAGQSRPVWLWGTLGGAFLLLVIGGALAFWLSSLWERGRDLEARLQVLGAAIQPETMLREPQELESLSRELSGVQQDLDKLVADAQPALTLASGLGWLPWIGGDLRSLSPLAERASTDLQVASMATQALAELQAAYQDLVVQALDPSTDGSASEALRDVALAVASQLRDAQATLSAIHDRTAGAEPRSTASMWDRLFKQEEELKAALTIGTSAADLLAALAEMQGTVRPLLQGGEGPTASAEALLADLKNLRARAEAARAAFGSTQAVLPEVDALIQPLEALATMSQGAELAAQSLVAILSAFGEGAGGPLRNGPGLARAITVAEVERPQLERAEELLRMGRQRMEELQSAGGQTPALFARGLDETAKVAAQMEAAVRLLRDMTPLAPSLLGLDGPRTYLVLGHSPDELRPTGGFVSTLWFVTFDKGELTELRYQDVVLVDDWDRLSEYPKAPPELEEHMRAWVWLTRDVSWEPQFPVVAQLAEDMIELGQQRRVDGVIAVNQWTFQRLIEALGEVPAPEGGDAITARNFLDALEKARDSEEKSYLDIFLRGLLSRLDQPVDQQKMVRLAAAMQSLLREKQLFFYVNDPSAQERLHRLGWSGELRDGPGDYLFVADSNVGWSKVDRNIEREIVYRVSLEPSGPSHAALTLTYRNRSGSRASSCARQWMPVERGSTYERLKQACYWDYVRVYLPAGVSVQDAYPFPLPPGSIAEESGRQREGDPTFSRRAAYGKAVLGGLLVVPAGEQRDVTYLYDLPSGILERDGDRLRYRLFLQPQAGTQGRMTTVEVGLPPGYRLVSSSLPITAADEMTLTFVFDLREDTVLDMVFGPIPTGGRP